MSGIRLRERLYGQTGKDNGSDENNLKPREDDTSVSHLLESIRVTTVKKKIVYGMEIKTLLYFRVRGK
jgi:hypothetical protein